MNISEGYNSAVANYDRELVNRIVQAGIPKNFCEAACLFAKEGIPIETLQDDFKKWNRYILNNPAISDGRAKDLRQFKTYQQFKSALQSAMQPFICPNPVYNDGNLSIGELKTQKDARWFPGQNLAYPDANNDYCISKKDGGYMQFQKYRKDGRRMFIIYDKQRDVDDRFKRVLMMSKSGILYFWDNYDKPCGTTKDKNDPVWQYIDSLPYQAQIALSEIAEGIKESKKATTVTITESEIRDMVKECAGKILLTEKYYNPAVEPMVDRKLGDYEVLFGSYDERIICDIRHKGWVRDIMMYSAMAKGGKTYALYRRCDNGKYFFAEIMDLPEDKEHLHAKVISPKSVPRIIWNDVKRILPLWEYVFPS